MADPDAAIRALRRSDRRFGELARLHGLPRLRRTRNTFQSLGQAIVYQQLTDRAAGTIYGRFLDLFPTRRFPTPSALANTPLETLRSAGLSGAKATSLHDLAHKVLDGTVRTRGLSRQEDAEIARILTRVKGIGPWSVDMFLIFGLVRPDVLPVGDLGVRKGMAAFFDLEGLPGPDEMLRLAEAWRPFRSTASWYMWRVAESGLP